MKSMCEDKISVSRMVDVVQSRVVTCIGEDCTVKITGSMEGNTEKEGFAVPTDDGHELPPTRVGDHRDHAEDEDEEGEKDLHDMEACMEHTLTEFVTGPRKLLVKEEITKAVKCIFEEFGFTVRVRSSKLFGK